MSTVDYARVVFALSPHRQSAFATDSTVLPRDPLAQEIIVSSMLRNESDANVQASNLLALRSLGRGTWELEVARGIYNPTIGDTVTITHPRFGLSSGKNFIVKAISRDLSSLFETWKLFGPQ